MFSTIYKVQKPRGFSYKPRYYSAEKERRNERSKRLQQDALRAQGQQISDADYIPHIRGQFKAKKELRSRIIHKQNIRIILIFFALLYLAYLFITQV